MPERREKILKAIVEEYLESAAPVGSHLIGEKHFNDISFATVRNDMAELEKRGLIYQPYTSAGRIPTVEGYRYYLDNFVGRKELDLETKEILDKIPLTGDFQSAKELAKALAELSSEAILVGFGPRNVYYTGLANLFSQPEFIQPDLVCSMSLIIDHLDEAIAEIFERIGRQVEVMLGPDNVFGEASAAIVAKCWLADQESLLGILGPRRMDYRLNIPLLRYAAELCDQQEKK